MCKVCGRLYSVKTFTAFTAEEVGHDHCTCREKLSRCSEAINVGVARCNNYVPEKNPDVIGVFSRS